MRNIPEWLLAFWACHTLGAVVVAVNAWAPLDSVLHCLANSQSKLVFVDEERAEVLKDSLAALEKGGCTTRFVARSRKQLPRGFEHLGEALKGCEAVVSSVEIDPEDLAAMYHTSGTTSLPKACYSTQRMFMSNRLNTTVATARATLRKGLDLPVPDPKAPQKSILLVRSPLLYPVYFADLSANLTQSVPLFHVIGSHSFMQLMTSVGGKVSLPSSRLVHPTRTR